MTALHSIWELGSGFAVFVLVVFGLALPLASRLPGTAAEQLTASGVLGLTSTYLISWIVFWLNLPPAVFLLLPALAIVALTTQWRAVRIWALDPSVRELGRLWLLVVFWCLSWLSLIRVYSGGGWMGDWLEHYQRTLFFLEHWPTDFSFIDYYLLPARPPLVNLTTGALLACTGRDFAHYQMMLALQNSLIVLPAWLLARRWSPQAVVAPLFGLLLMANPMFVQNTTFAWTKLITGFFLLSGIYFYLRAGIETRKAGWLVGVCLGAASVSHYSAGPWLVGLAIASGWIWWQSSARPSWRFVSGACLAFSLVIAPWFGWSRSVYGLRTTLSSNSTLTAEKADRGRLVPKIAMNVVNTVVPHVVRSPHPGTIVQSSRWGYIRDFLFNLYQVNLLFAFGSAGAVLVPSLLWKFRHRPGDGMPTGFWSLLLGTTTVLGIAVHGDPDFWGLAHICLQPLVILGLAWLATNWPNLPTLARRWLAAGLVVDGVLGIALHFTVQHLANESWLAEGERAGHDIYTSALIYNAHQKVRYDLPMFGEMFSIPVVLACVALSVVLFLMVSWIRDVRTSAFSPSAAG